MWFSERAVITRATLESLLSERVLVLDGAIGTLLLQRGFAPPLDYLTRTRPDVVEGVHHAYLEAGCDIIRTHTFNSTALVLSDVERVGPAAYDLNVAAARLARAACDTWSARTPDQPRFVAGTIGPTNRSSSLTREVPGALLRPITAGRLKEAYLEQARGLVDGGCDVLIVETIFDLRNAGAAIEAIGELSTADGIRPRLWLSATVSGTRGEMLGGRTIADFWAAVRPSSPWAVGLNCSEGARLMRPQIETLAGLADCFVSAHPSAGLPDAAGDYPESPGGFSAALGDIASQGLASIVGGCCGTTPSHIRALAETVRPNPPEMGRQGIV